MKGKVLSTVKGADGVLRGVILLHKGNPLERPLQAVCPLEIRSAVKETEQKKTEEVPKLVREKRRAAADAQAKIHELAEDDAI